MDNYLNTHRNIYIAALLSICPGLGHLYIGQLTKSIILYITFIFVAWGSAIAFMYIDLFIPSLVLLLIPPISLLLIFADSVRCAMPLPTTYKFTCNKHAWTYVIIFLFAVLTVNPLMDFFVGNNIVRAYFVASESMRPTVLKSDLLLINKLHGPERGDIALIHATDAKDSYSIFNILKNSTLRRIIAVSGDNIFIQGHKIFVNDKLAYEPYAVHEVSESHNVLSSDDYVWGPEIVPNGMFYVLSDSRHYTYDSRVFGFVKKEDILGIATKIFWSWDFETGKLRWTRTGMSLERNLEFY